MKQLIEFPLEGDGSVWVEVEIPEDEYGETEVSRAGDLANRATQTFQEALATVTPVAETIIGKLGNLSERPHEIEVEFGLKVSGNVGTIIAASGVEANFKVTLKWKREETSS